VATSIAASPSRIQTWPRVAERLAAVATRGAREQDIDVFEFDG
jgi:hypothetical protein